MNRPRFTQDDRLTIEGLPYKFVSQDKLYASLAREDGVGGIERFSYDEIAQFQKTSQWRFERDYYTANRKQLATSIPALTLDHLTDKQRKKTIWYYIICLALKDLYDAGRLNLTDASLEKNLALLQDKMNKIELKRNRFGKKVQAFDNLNVRALPCTKTIRMKFKTLRSFGYNILCLAPRWHQSGPSAPHFDEETEATVMRLIREIGSRDMNKPTSIAEEVLKHLKIINKERTEQGLILFGEPSQRTIIRRIETMNHVERYAMFHGVDAARKEFAMSGGGLPKQTPMGRIEFDECEMDVINYFTNLGIYDHLPKHIKKELPKGRRWFCCAIDTRTRTILGIRVAEHPSAEEAIKLLHMVVRDKTDLARAMGAESPWGFFGGLDVVACDTGSAFISDEFISAVTALGGTIIFPPVKVPELRGTIERSFGTLNSKLLTRVYGRTFHKPEARGDYDSVGRTILDDDDLTKILTIFIVDYYHNNSHNSLNFQSPANCWAELEDTHFVNAAPDSHDIRSALGVEMTRKLSKRGIVVFANHYCCDELEKYRRDSTNRKLRIKVDPTDIGAISILLGSTWVSVDATDCDLHGVHLLSWVTEFRKIREHNKAQAELSRDIRERALKNIDQTVHDAALRSQIGQSSLTAGDVLRLQKNLFHGASFTAKPNITPSSNQTNSLGQTFDTGTAAQIEKTLSSIEEDEFEEALSAPEDDENQQHLNFKLEDE